MTAPSVKVEPWPDGAAFFVKARAASRRDGVAGEHDGMLRVEVVAAPEKGKANRAIVRLLARELGVSAGDLALLSGAGGPKKRFGVRGMTRDELAERLRKLIRKERPG